MMWTLLIILGLLTFISGLFYLMALSHSTPSKKKEAFFSIISLSCLMFIVMIYRHYSYPITKRIVFGPLKEVSTKDLPQLKKINIKHSPILNKEIKIKVPAYIDISYFDEQGHKIINTRINYSKFQERLFFCLEFYNDFCLDYADVLVKNSHQQGHPKHIVVNRTNRLKRVNKFREKESSSQEIIIYERNYRALSIEPESLIKDALSYRTSS